MGKPVPVEGTDTLQSMSRAALLNLMEVAELMRELSGTATPTDASLRVLHKRAQKRRADGNGKATDLPAPDRVISGRPSWYESTIRRWWEKERADG